MNLLTSARFAANMMLILGATTVLILTVFGTPVAPNHLIMLAAIALLGGLGQFVVSVIRPGTIKPTWDEQNVASHRGSYQFGYWSALAGFWVLFVSSDWQVTDGGGAFLWMGVILMAAPSLWMVLATFFGRAG